MSFLYIESPPFLFTGERLFSGGDLTQQIIKYSVILPLLHYIKLCRPLSCRLRCISVVYAVDGVKREIFLAKREKASKIMMKSSALRVMKLNGKERNFEYETLPAGCLYCRFYTALFGDNVFSAVFY